MFVREWGQALDECPCGLLGGVAAVHLCAEFQGVESPSQARDRHWGAERELLPFVRQGALSTGTALSAVCPIV